MVASIIQSNLVNEENLHVKKQGFSIGIYTTESL